MGSEANSRWMRIRDSAANVRIMNDPSRGERFAWCLDELDANPSDFVVGEAKCRANRGMTQVFGQIVQKGQDSRRERHGASSFDGHRHLRGTSAPGSELSLFFVRTDEIARDESCRMGRARPTANNAERALACVGFTTKRKKRIDCDDFSFRRQ